MRRVTLRRLALSLALGAATTVGVAWVIATRIGERPVGARRGFHVDGNGAIDVYRFERSGTVGLHVISGTSSWQGEGPDDATEPIDSLVPAWARERLVPSGWIGAPTTWSYSYLSRQLLIRGWPLPCLWCLLEGVPNPTGYWGHRAISGIIVNRNWKGFARPWPGDPPVTLPYRPLWGAFAANTGVYAAAWWVLLVAPGEVRRALRRRRGRCASCGYDLSGLPGGTTCPECGRRDGVEPPGIR